MRKLEGSSARAKKVDKSLFEKHYTMMRDAPVKQQNRNLTLTENSISKKKFEEQLEIVRVRKEGKQNLINNVTPIYLD